MTRKLKWLTLVTLFCSIGHVQAQVDNGQLLSDSSRALQFSIGDNFTLHPFQGATLSYKYHLQRLTALRFGLTVSFGGNSNDMTSSSTTGGVLQSSTVQTTDLTNIHVQFGAQKVWYVEGPSVVFLYFGCGPYLALSYNSSTTENGPLNPTPFATNSTSENTAREYSGGVAGLVGVECFAARSISIHAEYGSNFVYSWSKAESTSTTEPSGPVSNGETKSHSWQFSSPGVTFGLSVYF